MRKLFFPFVALAFFWAGCGAPEDAAKTAAPAPEAKPITVYAAASMVDVLNQLAGKFTEQTGIQVDYNFAGSGSLARQIAATDHADVFISANPDWMKFAAEKGRLTEAGSQTLVRNALVVIARQDAAFIVDSAESLVAQPFTYLVVGDPKFVPAGQYAKAWLEDVTLPDGQTAWTAVEGRLSPMPDVRAALKQVTSSRELIGIVYRTDYQSAADQVKLLYTVPLDAAPPIVYTIAEVKGGGNPEGAAEFIAFLETPTAQSALESFGFVTGQP